MNADGSQLKHISDPGTHGSPSWSPDGKQIAFDTDRDGNLEVHAINFDGSGLLRMTNVVGHRRYGKQVIYGLAGRGTSGKDHVLELPVHHLIVRILPKPKA